jgi:hypothetical protein
MPDLALLSPLCLPVLMRRFLVLALLLCTACAPLQRTRPAPEPADLAHKVGPITAEQKAVLCDPQTSGGLLVAVDPSGRDDFLRLARARGLELLPFGVLKPAAEPVVTVL